MKIGISSCLLGNKVRFDGQHKLNRFLRDELGPFVEWVPVCPEMECGMPVPREALRLIGKDPETARLFTNKTFVDKTEQMLDFTYPKLNELEKENLRGFVFKTKSPTSGMRGVKIYSEKGVPERHGSGIFAREFMKRFPNIPVEDEGRLHDPGIRENFIEKIYIYDRWLTYCENDGSIAGFISFHTRHKYTFMAHAPALLKTAGKIVAASSKKTINSDILAYEPVLMSIVNLKATVKKHVNVLQHIMGYFKNDLSSDEKQELLYVIQKYADHYVPLIVPIVLLQHYVRKYQDPYLLEQWYLNPHPDELKLRNHV
ncbi:MAG: DUF523 and DUF1722 domain-containing protein [Candidatus Neomarinimicrobiota bacterium]|jgi:uncharacterized protein YbgA (DUF1722 family)/uncharacterized protein YbbK (DUF523 family)